jgi:ADP-ribosylglycohydrolase
VGWLATSEAEVFEFADAQSVVTHNHPEAMAAARAVALSIFLARGDGCHTRLIRALGRADLLILDDWGLQPLDATARHYLLEILEDRRGRSSTVITSQLPVDRRH